MVDDTKKLQLDYAWKWFSYHADQRVKLFNYMLVVFGALTAAIVGAINSNAATALEVFLCMISALLALAFFFLDGRNQYLVRLGEQVLTSIEKDTLFAETETSITPDGRRCIYPGILWRQERERAETPPKCKLLDNALKGKHRFWMRGIAVCFGLIFVALAAALWIKPEWLK